MAQAPQYALSEKLSMLDMPLTRGEDVVDAFTLMDALVAGSTNRGQYYAEPPLLRRLFWWQDVPVGTIQGWLDELVDWDEVEVAPLAWNCYGGIHDVVTINHRRRFKRWSHRPPISPATRAAVYARDGGACRHCGTTQNLSVDHIIAWSKGGAHDLSNFQTLCRPCNSRKGDR